MNFPYSINDLSSKCQVSKQSIYNLISKNKDFINENSTRQGRKIKYNQAVLDKFLAYYDKLAEEAAATEEAPQQPEIAPIAAPDDSQGENTPGTKEAITAPLEAEITTLRKEVEGLKQQLAAKEAERLELLKQNGALILTLQQEKQEKLLLLPGPKKTIGERFRGLFGKDKQGK